MQLAHVAMIGDAAGLVSRPQLVTIPSGNDRRRGRDLVIRFARGRIRSKSGPGGQSTAPSEPAIDSMNLTGTAFHQPTFARRFLGGVQPSRGPPGHEAITTDRERGANGLDAADPPALQLAPVAMIGDAAGLVSRPQLVTIPSGNDRRRGRDLVIRFARGRIRSKSGPGGQSTAPSEPAIDSMNLTGTAFHQPTFARRFLGGVQPSRGPPGHEAITTDRERGANGLDAADPPALQLAPVAMIGDAAGLVSRPQLVTIPSGNDRRRSRAGLTSAAGDDPIGQRSATRPGPGDCHHGRTTRPRKTTRATATRFHLATIGDAAGTR